jgi:DNA-binding CsgD family transcriptional regulator
MSGIQSERSVPLTVRQRQVLSGLARGMTAQEIAVELSISPRTVRMHRDMLRSKLAVQRCREIPQAYREATGADPSAAAA